MSPTDPSANIWVPRPTLYNMSLRDQLLKINMSKGKTMKKIQNDCIIQNYNKSVHAMI